jgi:hypothetical protein
MEEFVAVLRACWGPDPVQHDGRYFTLPPAIQRPKPVQSGGPLLISGASSPAGRARTAAIFDGWNPAGVPVDTVAAGLAEMNASRGPGQAPLHVFFRTFVQFLGPPEPLDVTLERLQVEAAGAAAEGFDEVILEHNFWHGIEKPDDWLRVPELFLPVVEAARG